MSLIVDRPVGGRFYLEIDKDAVQDGHLVEITLLGVSPENRDKQRFAIDNVGKQRGVNVHRGEQMEMKVPK